MNNFAHLGPDPDHNRADSANCGGDDAGADAVGAFQAGLLYVACDLRMLAKTAPPVKTNEVLALCRLVEAMATA